MTGPSTDTAHAEQHPDYDLHIKHTGPDQVTVIVWLMGRRYDGTLTCGLDDADQ